LRLRQILINLIGNALKFTHSGEIVVSIKQLEMDGKAVLLQFSVADTGIGMTDIQLTKIFDSFSQADDSTTRKYGGTGLGLVICRRLVSMMGGEIHVESQHGSGSTFTFTAVFSTSPRCLEEEFPIPAWMQGLKALIVDDSIVSRRILRYALESFFISVATVNSGEGAIAAVENAPVDTPYQLILMDMEMVGMNGIEASKRILATAHADFSPKIIMVTAYGQEKVARQAASAGIHGFLVKPVSKAALFDAILESHGYTSTRKVCTLHDQSALERTKPIWGSRVLLIEDNPINRQVATELLEQACIQVTVAENGEQGVALAGSGDYDLVLMDIQMPEMDGYTASRLIREHGTTALPIIAMTANAMAGDREKSLAAGMNDHLTKPIDPEEFYKTLTLWIPPGNRTVPPPLKNKNGTGKTDRAAVGTLPDIPGLDIHTGLARVNNNPELYLQLLNKLVEDHRNDAETIQDALQAGDAVKARRIVHTMKGIAGSIAAHTLQHRATMLEQAFQLEQADRIKNLLDDFAEILAETCTHIQSAVGTTPSTVAEQPVGVEQVLLVLLQELAPHVRKRRPKPAAEIMARIKLSHWPRHQHQLAELDRSLKKYRFKEAQALLDALLPKDGEKTGGWL